ncbi:AmmeMemoRadiSam system protein B [Candidatus Gottesmanbacteria bacterium RIFCSPHIGHO2_02_FULL_39_11]|uniref:AmmeMemoRadiSam system protein B n=1 Tax=Candidatus Gottesmanbacteria bacterium RIFCSPHIGHO2_02_FULL_39_11 TaxID=1798382 RepID=A0A1F5ZU75_9BACT|nr:MAG: AmmeMemoRadiSam system protein B [Candidatus Gottesmanbacteria bacterium RIFCSPHIGHO2_02_FULL_39_11]
MKKYLLIACVLCTAFISALFIQKTQTLTPPRAVVKDSTTDPKVEHSSHLFDPAFFSQAYDRAESHRENAAGRVFGGILPHHLLAAPLIAGFFEGIGDQKVDTVILLSPNHYGVGPYSITTSKGVWTTIFGDLESHTLKISHLIQDKSAFVSEDLFNREHGIYGITPFIKKTFPGAKMVPIVIKSGTSKEECDRLVESLNNIFDEGTIVIVSADFSHYLSSDEADRYDKESIPAIESFNTDKVFTLDHQKNIDSPESVYVLLKLMQLKNARKSILLANTNSAKLTNQPDLKSTTSYLTMYFTDQSNSLSTDDIFRYTDPVAGSIKNANRGEYTLIATGDVIPARSVNSKLVQLNNFNYPFEKTVSLLKSADAVLINLESPLISGCKTTIEGMIFCSDVRNIEGLTYAGVSVASIANNHAGNYGLPGIDSTVNLLKKNHIEVTGNGESAIITIKDKKFGFLGYNDIGHEEPGIAWANTPQIQQDVAALKKQADFVIVAFHWGVEYTSTPTLAQIELAHASIDAGADLIIGNHPHWVQGIEKYKGKFITYAHGNYVFDQMWSRETREGVLGKYTFDSNGLKDVKFFPVIIDNYVQPRFATESEANKILTRMKNSTEQIKGQSF